MHSEALAAAAVRPETAFTPSQFLFAHVREGRPGASRLFGLQRQMALQKGLAEGGTSSSTANNNQVLLAIPQRAFECPICLDTIEEETSVSWCRHTFCFPCILEWSSIRPVCPICQEHFQYFFRKKGGGILLQATGTTDLPAESAALAVPEMGKGTESGPGGGTMMVTAGLSRPRVMTSQAAGDGSTAGLRTWLLSHLEIGTELQGTSGVPKSAWGGESTVSGHNGIPPGNHGQQAEDFGGGPTVLGDKHKEKSKEGGITMRDTLPVLNRMPLTSLGGVSTISRHNEFPPGNPRQQGVDLVDPSAYPTALTGTGAGRNSTKKCTTAM
ncbi:uncharacterized protein LOC130264757 isoform X1 [Oenanthe melanoleuca]|uniref:uncharacterized protein LOC130264757 isoform X1 n=1 Tax=Oenanthe melanoleuca TaxID=2939378 RepID=UPI0024C1EED1|nr:uncharacterized protein LOC130264757 isoform X1 [Oenanthe melanoleuca]